MSVTQIHVPLERLTRRGEGPRSAHNELPMPSHVEHSQLAASLASRLDGEVRFNRGARAMYATDASNYRQVPIGVVVPKHEADVLAMLEVCRSFGAPIVSRGGGTSLAGQTCNAAVVVDFSKYMHEILELDAAQRYAVVEPGVILDSLRARAEEHHLTFGPDPSTHTHCTLGGMIGNNSCGVHSVMAGNTSDNVEELEIVTYSGLQLTVGETSSARYAQLIREGGERAQLYRALRAFRDRHADAIRSGFPDLPRRVSGYNLPALLPEQGFNLARALVGSEGTLVTVLKAKVRLVPSPPARALLVLGYRDVFEAADHVMQVLESRPIGLEAIDEALVEDMKKKNLHPQDITLLPEGRGWLLVEFGADTREAARASARALMDRLSSEHDKPAMKLFDDPAEERVIWKVRESGLGATARIPGEPDAWEGWEDSAVPPAALGKYLREFRALLERYNYRDAALYGHFGQGCVHTRIPFELRTIDGVRAYRSFVHEAADLVVSHGGSLSGEHGDGQSRAELLPKMFSPQLMRAFDEFKAIWDPTNKQNPYKVVDAYRVDENLRLGPPYVPPALDTAFKFPDDKQSLAYATERCVGVGECRRLDGGVMCPSFMVTREEQHSTRGRAHLLFEMARGETVKSGWKSQEAREALDLCLSCKGCKHECPMNVDMATYKAEFLFHHYRGRLRPRSAYAFGLIYYWAKLAALAPRLLNALLRLRFVAALFKAIAGIDSRRTLPRFATHTFRAWWRKRPARSQELPKVLLWIDTFNNHFQPEVGEAAVSVLEAAGFEVLVLADAACCGRPLYDYGMLNLARRFLRQTLDQLRPILAADIPIVGLEPSCIAVFRDELPNLFPDDPLADKLRKSAFMLDELLTLQASKHPLPCVASTRPALVHGHCHHKSVLAFDTQQRALQTLGISTRVIDAGCCGMAGGFGYERGHYDVSVACAEQRLLPAVRETPDDTLLVADGFSCREQIVQRTGRKALHTAQVLAEAIAVKAPAPDGGKA